MPEIVTWTLLPGFGLTLVIFGFAPPFLLRLILQMYPRDDPRRAELMAELRARPWRERPIWVVEQLETGLTEGLGHRIRDWRRRRNLRRLAKRQVTGVVAHINLSSKAVGVRVEGHIRSGKWVQTHYRPECPRDE